jgi:hypothetical protein
MVQTRREGVGGTGAQSKEDLSGANLVNIWQKYVRLEDEARILRQDNEQLLEEKTRALQVCTTGTLALSNRENCSF